MGHRKYVSKAPGQKRYGRVSYRDKAKAPKWSSIDTEIQHQMNKKRNLKTLNMDRYGVSLMWRVVPDEMKKAQVKPMGTYDKNNTHGGIIWGWKSEVPLTEDKVKRIMFKIIQRNQLSKSQLDCVRKAFSFSYQLKMGVKGSPGAKDCNWKVIKSLWKSIDLYKLPPAENSNLPTKIPTPREQKTAFRKPWTEEHEDSFLGFTDGTICAYDFGVVGVRAYEDVKRIKKSRKHIFRPEEGYGATEYVNGRCKSEIHRPWHIMTICFCPNGVHVSPAKHDFKKLNDEGNPPPEGYKWSSTCPLACWQFKNQCKVARNRRYAKVNKAGNGYTTVNEKDPVKVGIEWLIKQGVCEKDEPYSHNSGRKALARLLSKNNVSYEQGFEIHGDRHCVWQKNYQPDCPSAPHFDRRDQHLNPDQTHSDVRCIALRTIARGFGLGTSQAPPMSRQEKFMFEILRRFDQEKAEEIKSMRVSDSEEEGFWHSEVPLRPKTVPRAVPAAPVKRKRKKRKRDAVWEEQKLNED